MSKINIFGMGGLNENGKNTYIIEIDDDIFVLDAGLKFAMIQCLELIILFQIMII